MGRRIDALPASPIDQRSEASKFRFNLLMLNGCSIGGVGVRGTYKTGEWIWRTRVGGAFYSTVHL